MSTKAKALKNLYNRGMINADGVREALEKGIITEEEYIEIVGVQ